MTKTIWTSNGPIVVREKAETRVDASAIAGNILTAVIWTLLFLAVTGLGAYVWANL